MKYYIIEATIDKEQVQAVTIFSIVEVEENNQERFWEVHSDHAVAQGDSLKEALQSFAAGFTENQ